MVLIGSGALTLAAVLILRLPAFDSSGTGYGVSSGGYTIRVEGKSDIGVAKVATKDDVTRALGANAQSVNDPQLGSAVNFNSSRGQTLTYDFTDKNGHRAHIYVDMTIFDNQSALNALNISSGTTKAQAINGHAAYYMQPWTLGSEHQDRLLVVNGLKMYKFIMSQSSENLSMDSVAARATLIRLAQKAQL